MKDLPTIRNAFSVAHPKSSSRIDLSPHDRRKLLAAAIGGGDKIEKLADELGVTRADLEDSLALVKEAYKPIERAGGMMREILLRIAYRTATFEEIERFLRDNSDASADRIADSITKMMTVMQKDDALQLEVMKSAGYITAAIETVKTGTNADIMISLMKEIAAIIMRYCTSEQCDNIRQDLKVLFERGGWAAIAARFDPEASSKPIFDHAGMINRIDEAIDDA